MPLNMYAMINITDEDLIYAEKILLRKNQHFDAERIVFIKNLETIDLQAVPGSGKTTALLAKLLILERYMPLKNNTGIIVLSHTNAAVDEIRDRIGNYCPKLFSYPNFIGTIQNFVDSFLAIPYYVNRFKTKPLRIDNEIYDEKVENFLYNIRYHKYRYSNDVIRKINYIKNVDSSVFYTYRFDIDHDNKLILTKSLNSDKLEIKKPKGRTKKINYKDYSDIEKKELLEWFFKFKKEILINEHILHYDDAYFLAKCYIIKYPIKKILQKRFKYVFVDEMQDMDIHQYKLLETLFYDDGNSLAYFQRIGDKNQAIFNGSVKLEEIWKNRENTLLLNGSYRLNSKTAPIVEKLALTSNDVVGRNKNKDNSEIDIKPHIIVFDKNTIKDVIPKFSEIIKDLQKNGKIPKQPNNEFMAIAWRKKNDDADKIGLSDYWKDYSVASYKQQIDFEVLKDYLLFLDKEKKILESVRKNILNAFLKIMRLENILNENRRLYSKRKLLQFLKEKLTNEYEDFKLHIYKWSIAIIKGQSEEIFDSIKEYIPTFLHFFDKEIIDSNNFINNESEINIENIEIKEQMNIYKSDNIEIEIGTIHSAKGQTHTATLYLETFYQGKYESEYLNELFLEKNINKKGVYRKQALKMSYVGFSRPTHLFCIAIHKDRFDRDLSEINKEIWEVVKLE